MHGSLCSLHHEVNRRVHVPEGKCKARQDQKQHNHGTWKPPMLPCQSPFSAETLQSKLSERADPHRQMLCNLFRAARTPVFWKLLNARALCSWPLQHLNALFHLLRRWTALNRRSGQIQLAQSRERVAGLWCSCRFAFWHQHCSNDAGLGPCEGECYLPKTFFALLQRFRPVHIVFC